MEKLQNTQRSSKAYWSLLKIFLNNNKIPIIPALYHKNGIVIDFKKKAELFNSIFADQCSLISDSGELPRKLECLTQSRFSSIIFSTEIIAKMIQNLDTDKAHGHDQISIRILKLCSTSICTSCRLFLSDAWRRVRSQITGKMEMLFPSLKNVINKLSKTTVWSRYFLRVVKYLRNYYSTKYLNFSLKTI